MSRPQIPRILQKDLEEGKDIDFKEKQEDWNIYELGDGTILKIKLVLTGVKRLKKWKPDGTPIYLVNSTNIVRTLDIPQKLRKKPKPSSFEPV